MPLPPGEVLYPIGVIAESYGISQSRIRRMEKYGLLKPAIVDPETGYRLYNSENISRIGTILALKSLGFVNDDIDEHFLNGEDYSELYRKLEEKRDIISMHLEQLSRKIRCANESQYSFVTSRESYLYTKKERITITLESLYDLSRDLLYEAVGKRMPINYNRPLLIMTDIEDYHDFRYDEPLDITLCIPLREKVADEKVISVPESRFFSFSWSYPGLDYSEIVTIIDDVFRLQKLKQNGTVRAAYDIGGYTGPNISPFDTIMHILIPLEGE